MFGVASQDGTGFHDDRPVIVGGLQRPGRRGEARSVE